MEDKPEQPSSPSPPNPNATNPSHSQSASRPHSRSQSSTGGRPSNRRRRTEFHLPDGTKVLVALPSNVDALRKKHSLYTHTHSPTHSHGHNHNHHHSHEPRTQIEIVIHGSEEHTTYLQRAREHAERRAQEMRERLGADLLEEWDGLQEELGEYQRMMERAVMAGSGSSRLNANFERFGFDAQLRTGNGGNLSDEETEVGGGDGVSSSSGTDWSERRREGTTIKLFKRPVIKQYFHRGLLWRSSEETKVMSFELFFDLLYVGIIAINGDNASEHADGQSLLRFVVTFGLSWKIWTDVQQFISWFDSDDVAHRVEIVFLIACLLGLTTNTLQTFNHEYDTYSQLIGFFLAARLFLAVHAAYITFMLPLVRGMMVSQILITLSAAALWIASIHVHMPSRLGLTFTALAIELFGGAIHVGLFRYGRSHSGPLANRIEKLFDFYPAINIEHKVERTNAFVSLVFGYSVVSGLYQNAGFGLNAFLGKAVLGLVQAFTFNWLYFEVDGSNIHTHAIRRHVNAAFLWQNAHLTFIMGYILASAALSKLVVAADCRDSPLETLTEFYQLRSEEHVSLGLRFYYCTGLAVALLSMGLISFAHEHKLPVTCRLPKWVRLANRVAVCVVLFALPAAQGVDSLNLIGITTSLSVWVLLVELWGKSCREEAFWGDCQEARCYTAKCSKRRLEDAIKSDGEVDVVELGRGEKTGGVDIS
ncbi:bacterial low temperature requirement A protein-domain-containing protein [Coniochaeta sp. 2T2.1]|nr:bacterial low temperature requirement A protein-domain-containing protein [Coniochaeta sp. 2T2.1]